MKSMKIRIKRLRENAVVPTYAHTTDAGMDLYSTGWKIDMDGAIVYSTGISVEIPDGYVGLVFPRSSICKKDLLMSNSVGVIDSGYRGEITVKFKPSLDANKGCISNKDIRCYYAGDRIAQMIIIPYPHIEFEEVDELSSSERGNNGYGSTGR